MRPFTTLLLLLIGFTANAQFGLKNVQYRFKSKTIIQECDIDGAIAGFSKKTISGGSKFTIVGMKDGNYIISVWNWTPSSTLKDKIENDNHSFAGITLTAVDQKHLDFNQRWDGTKYLDAYFLIDAAQLESFTAPLKSTWQPSYGTIVLPFKVRKDFQFTRDVSLSGMGGVKLNVSEKNDFGISALIGPGISVVQIDSASTEGKVMETSDRAAFSLQGGIVFQWQRLQFGFFLGGDWLTSAPKKDWIHQGKPWFGIGVGLAIFSDELSKKKTGDN